MTRESALLIIDVQVGIIDGLGAYRGREVVGQISNLRSEARAASLPVNFVQHDGEKGHPLEVGIRGGKFIRRSLRKRAILSSASALRIPSSRRRFSGSLNCAASSI